MVSFYAAWLFGCSREFAQGARCCRANRKDVQSLALLNNESADETGGGVQASRGNSQRRWQRESPGNRGTPPIDIWALTLGPRQLRACPVYRFHEFALLPPSSLRDRLVEGNAPFLLRKSTSASPEKPTRPRTKVSAAPESCTTVFSRRVSYYHQTETDK